MVTITILGSGSINPTPKRFGSGIFVSTSSAKLLLDPGPATIHRLTQINIAPQSLDAILVTHFHLDHVADLLPMIMLWAYDETGNPATTPKPMRIMGPQGTSLFIRQITEIDALSYLDSIMKCNRYIMIDEMKHGESRYVNKVVIRAAEVEHFNGLAYRLECDGCSVVFSGDTVPDRRLIDLAKGCDLLIHECSFPHGKLVGKHTSEKQLAEVVAEIMPKKVVVTHLYPVWSGRESEIVAELVRREISDVIVAEDMLTVEI